MNRERLGVYTFTCGNVLKTSDKRAMVHFSGLLYGNLKFRRVNVLKAKGRGWEGTVAADAAYPPLRRP
jgi:hypothetical protein